MRASARGIYVNDVILSEARLSAERSRKLALSEAEGDPMPVGDSAARREFFTTQPSTEDSLDFFHFHLITRRTP